MKKSKFKMVAGIAAIAMSFALLAGCNPGDDATATTEEPTPVTPTGDEEVEEEDVVVTLLDTAIDIDWGAGAKVEADKLSSATDASKFVVTYTSNSETDYHKFKMANLDCSQELYAGKETNITIDRTSSNKDDLHGCSFVTEPSETPATFSYQPTADEWKVLKEGGFNIYGHGVKITKIELVTPKDGKAATPSTEKPATPTNNTPTANPTTPTTGTDTTKTYGECKLYTVTTNTDVAAANFAMVLQLDNDGSQDENGLKVDVTNFKLWLKVGDAEAITVTKDTIKMIPNPYITDAPYSKTDCRFVLDGLNGTIASGTQVQFKVLQATVNNKDKADSIIYALQKEGDGYGMWVADSDNYKAIFAAKE